MLKSRFCNSCIEEAANWLYRYFHLTATNLSNSILVSIADSCWTLASLAMHSCNIFTYIWICMRRSEKRDERTMSHLLFVFPCFFLYFFLSLAKPFQLDFPISMSSEYSKSLVYTFPLCYIFSIPHSINFCPVIFVYITRISFIYIFNCF